MLICGAFDQHNFTAAGFFILACSAGIILAPGNEPVDVLPRKINFLLIPGILLLAAAINSALINFSATSKVRQGDLKLFAGDINGAYECYNSSIRELPTPHALYQLCRLSLAQNRPIDYYLNKFADELKMTNYRHTRRLQAIAAYSAGDFATALEAMEKEFVNAPYSVISADFQRYLLRAAQADERMIIEADMKFSELCRMRELTPEKIADPAFETIDDGAFPEKARQEFFDQAQ